MDYSMIISSPTDGHYSPTASSSTPSAVPSYHHDNDGEEIDTTDSAIQEDMTNEDDEDEEEDDEDEDDEDDDEDNTTTDDATAIAAGVTGTTTPTPTTTSSPTSNNIFIHATPTLPSLTNPTKTLKIREITQSAIWSLSTAKPGNGVHQILDSCPSTYWQSDGAQPHYINIQFAKRCSVCEIAFYLDYNLDESYTPKEMSVRVGMTSHDLVEKKVVSVKEPVGWCVVPLWEIVDEEDGDGAHGAEGGGGSFEDGDHYYVDDDEDDEEEEDVNGEDTDGRRNNRRKKKRRRRKPMRGHFVQVCVKSMHQNGRDTHIRQVKIFGPRNNEELSKRSGTSTTAAAATTASGSGKPKRRGEKETWVCGVPKFQTVSMSQFSTIR